MQFSRSHYTFVGCLAPICWGMSVPFVRLVAEHVGQPLGMMLLRDLRRAACGKDVAEVPHLRRRDGDGL